MAVNRCFRFYTQASAPAGVEVGVGDEWNDTTTDTLKFCTDTSPITWVAPGGSGSFLTLTDTPDSYATHGGKNVRVNAGETALEFVAAGAPGLHDTTHEAGGSDVVDAGLIRRATDPASPAVGETWVNAALLKFRDNAAPPATKTVQVRGDVITDAEHGARTVASAHGHGDLTGITADQHHAQSHGAADHSGDVLPDGSNQVLGTGDVTITQKAAPANPAAGDRKIYVDSTTGKLSVRTSGGSSVSLEEQGGSVTYAAPSAEINIGDAAVEGVATTVLRSDSQFAFPAPAAGYPVDVDLSAEADGTATTSARSDHKHSMPAPAAPADVTKAAAATGTSNNPARQDHKHDITTAVPVTQALGDVAAEGTATSLGRSDHRHGMPANPLAVANGGTGLTVNPKVEAVISAASLKGTTTAGAGDANKLPESRELATNLVNIDFMAFDQTTSENGFFQYSIPKGWDEGTITFRVKWTAAAGTGGVVFGLKGLARSDDDPIDAAFGTEVTVTDTLIATNDVHISPESAALTVGGTPAEGDIVFFNLARKTADAGDTLTADAQLLEIVITFTRNSYTD